MGLKYTSTVTVPPPYLMVLGAGPFQGPLLTTARGMGVTTVALDQNPAAASRALADAFVQCDIADISAVLACARARNIIGVVSAASDVALPAHAAVAEALGLPGPTPDSVRAARNKERAALRLRATGVPCPETVSAESGAPVDVGGYPIIVKPAVGAGGRGVSIVERSESLGGAVSLARQYGSPLYQRFVTGAPLGLEAFIVGGRIRACFAFEDQLGADFPSPIGHATPAPRYVPHEAQLQSLAQSVVDALGLTDGGLNLDLRWGPDGPVVLEVNPRSGGAQLGPLVRYAYGVDLCAAAVSVALGIDPAPHLEPKLRRPAATRLFVREGRGIVRLSRSAGRDPLAHRRTDPRLITAHLDIHDGQPSTTGVDRWSLLGHCLVSGATVDEAIALADEIDDHVSASVEVLP